MRVLVTGAGGFIGRALCRQLIDTGTLIATDGRQQKISELVLVDRSPLSAPAADGLPIRTLSGDLRDDTLLAQSFEEPVDSIFHLAATLTIDAERDPDSGWAINMMLPHRLLESCRAQSRAARFVYASSIAVFGGVLPERVNDRQYRSPQTAYGTAKAITELLIDDYSRQGIVDGRALRLPIVLLREAAASRTVSDIVAAIAREPLAGRQVESPISESARFPVVSVGRVARSLIQLHDQPASALGASRAVNQPGLTVSVRDIIDSLNRVAGADTAALVRIAPDPGVDAVINGWPSVFVSDAQLDPPLQADADFDSILHAYLAKTGQ